MDAPEPRLKASLKQRDEEPVEYNSDLDPTATELAREEDKLRWMTIGGISPEIGWEEFNRLYRRYQAGQFWYKDWNYAYLIQQHWRVYIWKASPGQRQRMGEMVTIGGAMAAHAEALRDRWRFVDRVTWAWFHKLHLTYKQLLAARSSWAPHNWTVYERKSGKGGNLWEAFNSAQSWQRLVWHIRKNTPIYAEMQAPPRLLQKREVNRYFSWVVLIPLQHLMSMLINIGLILSWAGWSPPVEEIKRGMSRVIDYLTEEQEEALEVIASYIHLNDKWRMKKKAQRRKVTETAKKSDMAWADRDSTSFF